MTNNFFNHIGANINNNITNNINNNIKNDDNLPLPTLKPNVSITTAKDESRNQKCRNNNVGSVQSTATILVSKKSKIKVKYPLLV